MDSRVEAVLERLRREWRQQHRVADLAASVNLGASRLSHLIRAETNTTIRDLLRRRRIAEAAHRLATTYDRVSEISYYVGFTDVCNFNHAFRREFGLSPRAYREKSRRAAGGNDGDPAAPRS
jgi:AraC family transcriptional regulator of arabinose operon